MIMKYTVDDDAAADMMPVMMNHFIYLFIYLFISNIYTG